VIFNNKNYIRGCEDQTGDKTQSGKNRALVNLNQGVWASSEVR
jgi:hypothetical protein